MKTRKTVWMFMLTFGVVGCRSLSPSMPHHVERPPALKWYVALRYSATIKEDPRDPTLGPQKAEAELKIEPNIVSALAPKVTVLPVATLGRPVVMHAR